MVAPASDNNPRTSEAFYLLPRFLIAEGDDRDFVVHCHFPRFVMEIPLSGCGTPIWIDEPSFDAGGGEPAAQMAALLREAGDFFMEMTDDCG